MDNAGSRASGETVLRWMSRFELTGEPASGTAAAVLVGEEAIVRSGCPCVVYVRGGLEVRCWPAAKVNPGRTSKIKKQELMTAAALTQKKYTGRG